jgi:ATP-binding cassette, subfamily C, bacterial LapB
MTSSLAISLEPGKSIDSGYEAFFLKGSQLLNCLDPLLRQLGFGGGKHQIAEMLPHFAEKLDINDFCKIMDAFGYQCESFNGNLSKLDKRLPAFLFVSDDRVQVVLDMSDDALTVFDGEQKTQLVLERQACRYNGTAFVFSKKETFNHSHRAKKKWFGKILARFKPLFFQVFVVSLFLNVLSLATPLFVMMAYDKVITTGSMSLLMGLSIGLLITLAGILVLQTIRSKILAYIGARLDSIVGTHIFQQLVALPTRYTENATVGSQVSRLKDFDTVREFFTGPFITLIFELPFSFAFLAMLWFMGGTIIIVPIVMLLLFAFATVLLRPVIHRAIEKSAKHSGGRHEFLVEAFSNYAGLKYCAAESVWIERHKKLSADAAFYNFKATFMTSVINATADLFMVVTGLGVITIGVLLVMENAMSIGALIAIMILVWKILMPIKTIFANLPRIDQVKASIAQINMLMEIKPEREMLLEPRPRNSINGSIEFNRVSLRYDAELEPAVVGIQLNVKPGELVMISGKNGAGKSTLLKLILRLYQPQAGGVRISGKDIRQMDCAQLRQSVAYVPQVNQFYYGTIEQNLKLANPLVTQEEMIAACKLAGLYRDILNMPEGLQTRLRDQNKQKFSISFQQRLSLARAYVKKSRILLLDEPTNNLDEQATNDFLHALAFFRRKTTILMVTHRPSLIKLADRLIYMNEGHLVYEGVPDNIPAQYKDQN